MCGEEGHKCMKSIVLLIISYILCTYQTQDNQDNFSIQGCQWSLKTKNRTHHHLLPQEMLVPP